MNKDKLTNDTTSGKTQVDPISGSDGFDGSDNPPPKGDSCSENTSSSPTGSDNSSAKGDTPSPPTKSDNPPPKGDSSPPSPRPPITKGKPSKSGIESSFPSDSGDSLQSSNEGSSNEGSDNPSDKGK